MGGLGVPYRRIGMVNRSEAEVDCANEIELRRVCRYFRYSHTVRSGI
jgi:hypothetical protein